MPFVSVSAEDMDNFSVMQALTLPYAQSIPCPGGKCEFFQGINLYSGCFLSILKSASAISFGKRLFYEEEEICLRAFPNIKMTLGEIFEGVE